jgi:HSP20 family molecular chaperone IbpA
MAAIAFVLGGLVVSSGGGKFLWDKYKKISTSTPYDVVIRIDSLAALATSGWEIVLGQNIKHVDPKVSESEEGRGVIVAVLGSYNRGKSFLLNQLCDINLRTGNLIHTEGISITEGRNQAKNIIFIDTAGTDTAIPKDKLDDKKATEALLREIALHLCSHIIIVVNRLRATDQSYIRQVLTHSKSPSCTKNIIIIHNLMDVETQQDIDEVIDTEVKQLFEAKLDTIQLKIDQKSTSVHFFRSTHNGMKLRHFIFAKHGSEAAKLWNRQSIDGIMNILQTATEWRRNLDVVTEMINFVNTKLPQLFINNHKQDNSLSETNQQKIQVQQHLKKPFIVLSHRREMDDLEQSPDELILSPKLLYDDAGYFIGISSMTNGQWQPLYSLYESNDEIHAVVELAGFKKGDVRVQVVEEAIIIEGRRADFKESLTNPSIHQEKIPTGQFKLEIPLQCKIDPETTKLERDEGFYKITCPKKKIVAKIFE